ncbi:hypothetical protein CesoFtcFv8_006891 [Champsocephalus esox]|uniref:Uncharacterized protein n=1 Tax=Champsocephalus esox TaxID=159716 RepID=A0AAN8CG59_9TELE|nr:hypothetical protein CesoFtcFv8_006891 [Champsocephalus esox]
MSPSLFALHAPELPSSHRWSSSLYILQLNVPELAALSQSISTVGPNGYLLYMPRASSLCLFLLYLRAFEVS